MAKVIVRHPVLLNNLVADPTGATVWGEGLDQLQPRVELTPVIRAAFACRSRRVNLKDHEREGIFELVADWVEVNARGARMIAHHYCVYEFGGWNPLPAG